MGVHIEISAELMQRRLDLAEHQVHADSPEYLVLFDIGKTHRIGGLGQYLRGDIADIGTGVTVFGRWLTFDRGDQRVDEAIDLGAVVIEVVLAHHCCTLGGQQPAQCVADGGPPGAADVNRAGRVGRDELEVDVLPVEQTRTTVIGAGRHDIGHHHALSRCLDPQIDESGPGYLRRGDCIGVGECGDQPARELARVRAGLLAHLQREIGRIISVLGVARTLDGDRLRQCGGVEAVFDQHRGGGAAQQLGEIGGGHGAISYALGLACPTAQRMRPRSSGDRASASGAEGRRFESCRGHFGSSGRIDGLVRIPTHRYDDDRETTGRGQFRWGLKTGMARRAAPIKVRPTSGRAKTLFFPRTSAS